MLAAILAHLYKLHLHPSVKKKFPIFESPSISMILQSVKNKSKVPTQKSEVVKDLAL
jgi:hypothetical protein